METGSLDKRKKIVGFTLLLLGLGFVIFLLLANFGVGVKKTGSVEKAVPPSTPIAAPAPVDFSNLIDDNSVLMARLQAVQLLDQQYADMIVQDGSKTQLENLGTQIYAGEELLRGSIDSLALNPPLPSGHSADGLFNAILSSYKSILEDRGSIGSLRAAAHLDKINLTPEEIDMLKVQNQLKEKNDRITALENEIKKNSILPKNTNTDNLNAATEDATALKNNIGLLQNQLGQLNSTNAFLKLENDKLIRQQTDFARNTGVLESNYKSKNNNLQQKVESLSAELKLAQVDCNISRADASQIISNSKQRKQLLSDASGLLTSLASTDDADLKRKVQEKIIRLNKVAANTRD